MKKELPPRPVVYWRHLCVEAKRTLDLREGMACALCQQRMFSAAHAKLEELFVAKDQK